MRKMKTRMVCLALALCLAVYVPRIEAHAITQASVASQLDSYIRQYAGTTAKSEQLYMGIQCKGFANWIFKNIFGVYIGPYPESANYKITDPKADTIGVITPGNLTESSSKALLQKGKPGDYIQVQRSIAQSGGKCGPHSMILVEVKADGVQVFDCNSDGKNTIKTYLYTWAKFDYDNRGMSLYRGRDYDVGGTPGADPTPAPSLEEDNSYPTPITAYPAATSGKITVYDGSLAAYDTNSAYISYNDKCTIHAVYTNGYCKVAYPVSNGVRTEYARTADFIANGVSPYAYMPPSDLAAYTRSNLSEPFGTVFSTDRCVVVGRSGDKLELIYPVSGGYKLGWANVPAEAPSDFPTPLKGYNASPTERTTVYESVNTMGTYYGQIFVDDQCTLNAVNVSDNWIQVTYPVGNSTKTGYVYLDQFLPSGSRLATFYNATVTQQATSYRKSDMAVPYGYVSPNDPVTVVGKSGNKLQVVYSLDAGGYKLAWIYDTHIKKSLKSISVASAPQKAVYMKGEGLDTSGLAVMAHYDDGSTQIVSDGYTVSGFDSKSAGTKTITVSYNGKAATFSVMVIEPNEEQGKEDGNSPQIWVDFQEAKAGERVKARIGIKDNPGIISLRLRLAYDADALALEGAAAADFDGTSFGPLEKNPFTVSWSDAIHGNNSSNGTVAELDFCVKEGAAAGNYPLTITYDAEDVFNLDFENVSFGMKNGGITVLSAEEDPGEGSEGPGEGSDGSSEDPGNPGEDPGNPGEGSDGPGEGSDGPSEDPGNPGEEPKDPGVGSHVHILKRVVKKTPTCLTQGNNAYFSCEGCGKYFKDQDAAAETTPAEEKLDFAPHEGGAANCSEKAICQVCKEAYGELDSSNHNGRTEVRNAVAATSKNEGYTGDIYCQGCGERLEEGETIPKTPQKPALKKGDEAKVGVARYRVLDAKKKTAALVKADKNATKLTVPATVKINGITCKVVRIGSKVLPGGNRLKQVSLGKNITMIEKQAFANCKKLERVTLGKSVTAVGKQAFINCRKLKAIQLEGKLLKEIQPSAFKHTAPRPSVWAPKMSGRQKTELLKKMKKSGLSRKAKIK